MSAELNPWLVNGLLLLTGLGTGFINTVAGGGSLITLPILIFLGMDPNVANGTNRIAILMQNLTAIGGFHSKGVSDFRYSWNLGLFATAGSVLGTLMAVYIDGSQFNKALAVSMLVISALIIIRPEKYLKRTEEDMSPGKKALASVIFFFIGIFYFL
jgi:uncharacterized membrane protein YfcA